MSDLERRIGAWLTRTGRWRAGMLLDDGSRIVVCNASERETSFSKWIEPEATEAQLKRSSAWARCRERTPDITDGPTRGALEDILWERWPGAVFIPQTPDGGQTFPMFAVFKECPSDAWDERRRYPGDIPNGTGSCKGKAVARALLVAYADEIAP